MRAGVLVLRPGRVSSSPRPLPPTLQLRSVRRGRPSFPSTTPEPPRSQVGGREICHLPRSASLLRPSAGPPPPSPASGRLLNHNKLPAVAQLL